MEPMRKFTGVAFLTLIGLVGQGLLYAQAKKIPAPTVLNAEDLAAKQQEKLDDAIRALDGKLAKVEPCRFGDIDAIFTEIGLILDDTVKKWNAYYGELIRFAERQLAGFTADSKALPGILAKNKAQSEATKREMERVNQLLSKFDVGVSPTPALSEAKKALEDRKKILDEEIREIENLLKTIQSEQDRMKTLRENNINVMAILKSMVLRQETMKVSYESLLRSKRMGKERACTQSPRLKND